MAYKDKTQGNLYNNKYKATHYDRTLLLFPKGFKSEVMEAAQKSGKTMSAYVVEAIRTRMTSEGFNLDIADPDPRPVTGSAREINFFRKTFSKTFRKTYRKTF